MNSIHKQQITDSNTTIKNLIFDFGDIFINLDKSAIFRELKKLGLTSFTPKLEQIAISYEKGLISSDLFIQKIKEIIPNTTTEQLIYSWNAIILDFPENRLEFLEKLSQESNYRIFLLSNTNALHIEQVILNMSLERFNRFKNCFEQFYLSHEIHLRKPDADIYQFVLDNNSLNASETLFIDDMKENTDTAKTLGIKTWNLLVGMEDVVNLKSKL
ncbi:MAG: HAD family phosphatase [Cellulophaga sp.]